MILQICITEGYLSVSVKQDRCVKAVVWLEPIIEVNWDEVAIPVELEVFLEQPLTRSTYILTRWHA